MAARVGPLVAALAGQNMPTLALAKNVTVQMQLPAIIHITPAAPLSTLTHAYTGTGTVGVGIQNATLAAGTCTYVYIYIYVY